MFTISLTVKYTDLLTSSLHYGTVKYYSAEWVCKGKGVPPQIENMFSTKSWSGKGKCKSVLLMNHI